MSLNRMLRMGMLLVQRQCGRYNQDLLTQLPSLALRSDSHSARSKLFVDLATKLSYLFCVICTVGFRANKPACLGTNSPSTIVFTLCYTLVEVSEV